MIAEITPELAQTRAQEMGFNRATDDWRKLVADPNIDVVDICSPNFLHKEMAMEAISMVNMFIVKPLALTLKMPKKWSKRLNKPAS
ncbi:Gfo/Idh/MocA family oxidoreductase [Providencia rettgeri]|uniref:Gfo/Idh/MocA family oxidoreductase n=1 Tax=Providencia rettgeri TaxID=587 RepID=A0A939NK70_PRORE|nr:Gfo/Idh/MocA family oxidoreductase [Providencia rettgeri]